MTFRHPRRGQRRLIAVLVVVLGLLNVAIAAAPHPFLGYGQFRHLYPGDIVNGGRFVLVILGILLAATAPGLWTGKRVAWGIALASTAGSIAANSVKDVNLIGIGFGAVVLAVLLYARGGFPARSDPPTAVRGLVMLVAGLAFVFVYSTLGLYFLDREFVHPISFSQALRDSVQLMFIVPATEAAPKTQHGSWFVDSVRVAFLSVMALGLLLLVRPVIYRRYTTRREREQVRALLEKYADSRIAFFALLPDKLYFFSNSGNAVIAYKAVGANAIALGEPIGDPTEFRELVSAFLQYCDLNGWACAFHQVRPKYLPLFESVGLKALKIGEEAVAPAEFNLEGHQMKGLRWTVTHLERDGCRTEVLSPPHDAVLLHELRQISNEWLALGKRRERTFTLGYFDEGLLQQCEVMVVRAHDDRIVAFATIVPSYKMPEGNFDMLRYGRDPPSVSDYLYVSLIKHFRDQGRPGMNLGLVPFSGIGEGEARSPVGRAMQLLYTRGGFLFRSKGLREFKGKFRPAWEPRYLVYESDLQLPGIALAVARAGELREQRRRGTRPTLRRYAYLFRGAIVITTLMAIASAITTGLALSDPHISSAIGLSVHALKVWKLWVISLDTLVQAEPVMKWGLLPFAFGSVAILEYQVGTLRAVFTFFISDWVSSPLTRLLIWGLGSAGLAQAKALENLGDTGVSNAGFGALMAGFFLLREPWRRLLMGGMFGYLIIQFTFERLDVSIAHLLASFIGFGLVWFFWRKQVIREINTDELWLTKPFALTLAKIKEWRERTSPA